MEAKPVEWYEIDWKLRNSIVGSLDTRIILLTLIAKIDELNDRIEVLEKRNEQ